MKAIFYVVLFSLAVLSAAASASPALSNSGGGTWKYQRDISVKENSGTALADYQVLVELKGTDFPVEAQSSGADIRFTDSNGKELNYWIENLDHANKSARVWVKMPYILAGATATMRMYYGNPSAERKSNGTATFEFFDDFAIDDETTNWETVGTDKWTIKIATKEFEWYTAAADGEHNLKVSKTSIASPLIIEFYSQMTRSGDMHPRTAGFGLYNSGKDYMYIQSFTSALNQYVYNGSASLASILLTSSFPTARTPYRVIFTGTLLQLWRIDTNTKVYEGIVSGASTSYKPGIYFLGTGAASAQVTDYFEVKARKYSSPEPTIALVPPRSIPVSVTKSASPYSIRQFTETSIRIYIENNDTKDITDVEVMDSLHRGFELVGSGFPNPKKYAIIRAGESKQIEYTIRAKENGTFTLDPVTVTYADKEGNIQEIKSEPVSIRVIKSATREGIPGFEVIIGLSGMLFAILLKKRRVP